MAGASDELVLLERVFFRLGSADTDDQLQNVVAKFLPPVLLKLSSQQEGVRKKVMELLLHINKRVKCRPLVRLPVDALLLQYQDPSASSFVINFTIIYIKMGFPRLSVQEQVDLLPVVLNSLESKPQTHQESLVLLIIPLLGEVKVPADPAKRSTLYGLNERPQVTKLLLSLLLDMLLLPYGALSPVPQTENDGGTNTPVSFPVPAGMSELTFKRVSKDNPMKPESLEHIKLGIVKFLATEIFTNEEILIHLIVAAADTRFSIANLADMELKKVASCIDWTVSPHTVPIYGLFFGTLTETKPELKKSAANTRIRLKLLTYLCRISGNGFLIPPALHVIFESLFAENTTSKLKTLALQFAGNIIKQADSKNLLLVAGVLQSGLRKVLQGQDAPEPSHQGQAYYILGLLGARFPTTTYHDVGLLELYFQRLAAADTDADLKLQVREGLLNLVAACRYDVLPDECDKDNRLTLMYALINHYINSDESMARFVAVRAAATIFPPNHVPSKLLLLLSTEDSKDTVFMEAFKALYGTSHKSNIDTDSDNSEKIKVVMPKFADMTKYVYCEATKRLKDGNKKVVVGNQTMPFSSNVYTEVLIYLRLCLTQSLNVPMTREIIRHPSENTPAIKKYLQELYNESKDIETNSLLQYVFLVKQLLVSAPAIAPLCCMVEIVGCVPALHGQLSNDLKWLKTQLSSMKEEIREHSALLFAIVCDEALDDKEFDETLAFLQTQTDNKLLESQHGAILAIGYCLDRRIMKKKRNNVQIQNWDMYNKSVETIAKFLKSTNAHLLNSACTAIGLISRVHSLPVPNGKPDNKNGSPDPKRPATITKIYLVNLLLDLMNNIKLSAKCREKAARSLGLLCVGEVFPFTREVLQGLLNTAKETKDVEVHFTIGESLVMSILNVHSPEARDAWSITEEDFSITMNSESAVASEDVKWLIDELLRFAHELHPNVKQASCIWLLAVLKSCAHLVEVKSSLSAFQNAFMNLLGENNDIVQDVASKGLCLVYDYSKSEELLNSLVDQLTSGRRQVAQVSSDTKLFEEGQLGQTPTGGKLTTYKELCSLASDLNKPDMIYQFMHLANHNAVWNSKKGAAFGFSSIAQKCGDHLKQHLYKIVPKLYIYQYDPNPNIQTSMQNIWHTLIPETQKTLDTYHNEILKELLSNLTSNQYRVRQSCCLALQDFLKGAGNRSIHDSAHVMEELWTQLFRVMDDHHEATRIAATKTTKVLSRLCIRGCDVSHGKAGVKLMESILPILLTKGITNAVADVRIISLQTISELVGTAGKQLKPFLGQLIPALLQATGELESTKMSYLSTMFGAQSQAQEVVDNVRASSAKSHFTTETVSKCLQYADASILEELVPKVVDLMRASMGLGSRIVCAHFITLLVIQVGQDLQPYTGKFLTALVNGLTDRNSAVRKHYACAIGHLVSTAKASSLEKLFAKIQHLYFEREDDSIRSACAYTIQSIGIHNQDILKEHSDVVLPLIFFAMNGEKTPDTQHTLDMWTEIWSEHSPGTESGIRQNIQAICDMLKTALESPSWNMKAQAANSVSTVATKLGNKMDPKHRNMLIKILMSGLSGRTWNGKDKLLKALASICISCKEILKDDPEIDLNTIIDAVLKECRKEEIAYKIVSLECLGNILHSVKIDRFEEVYNIVETVLLKAASADDKTSDDESGSSEGKIEKRENNIKLRETIYEVLGKAWPENGSKTQEKYRDQYVTHCSVYLPTCTRNIQVALVSSLCSYVDKLDLIAADRTLNKDEEASLSNILDNLIKSLDYCLGLSKNTRLRKEALNVILALVKKLKVMDNAEFYNKLDSLFEAHLENLTQDNQPEIKSRVVDLKTMFKNA